jgi:hypothetical protein
MEIKKIYKSQFSTNPILKYIIKKNIAKNKKNKNKNQIRHKKNLKATRESWARKPMRG